MRITSQSIRAARRIVKRLEAPAHPKWTHDDWQRWQRAQVQLAVAPLHLRPRILFSR